MPYADPAQDDVDAKRLIDRICDSINQAVLLDDLKEFAKRTKLSGSASEFESFEYIKARFDALGYKTSLIRHDAYISLPGEAKLQVAGEDIACITHSFSPATSGVTAGVIDLGRAASTGEINQDVLGKVVLLDGIAFPDITATAGLRDAAALIYVNPANYRHEMCISPVWGSPDFETRDRLPRRPVVSVSQSDGQRIRTLLSLAPETTAFVQTSVETGWKKTPLLTAELLPIGAGERCPFIMFSGHHDTWHHGVMDNGAANATMLAVAQTLAKEQIHWRRGLRFCFWSGHSHGRYSGSAWYADTNFHELEARCAAHVNVDSTGGLGASVLIDTPVADELYQIAYESVRVQATQSISGHRHPRAGDQSFWGIGVPAIFMGLSEQPAGNRETNGITYVSSTTSRHGAGFGWWWHTEYDTIDKIDLDNLLRDTRVYAHALTRLVCDQHLPLDYQRWIGAFETVVRDLEAKTDDLLDYTHLHFRLGQLRQRLSGHLTDHQKMAISRALVPIDYTRGDRFVHDAALSAAPYPSLTPIRRLAETPTGDDRLFCAVAARQALNRVISMVGSAVTAASSIGGHSA